MLTTERVKTVSIIGLPIMGGMISGVLLGLVDSAMVSSLGNAALGAVGFSSFLAFVFLGLFYGFSIAVQATVARRKGEGNLPACGRSLGSAVFLISISAPVLSLLLYFAIPFLFPLINNDPDVIDIGVKYIRWLILQAVFVGFIAANTGFWNGIGQSRIYIPSLIFMHLSNVVFNYMFIFGNFGAPQMGAEGAGFATALSSIVGTGLFLFLGLRYGGAYHYMKERPVWSELKGILRLAIPAGLQQVLDTLALTITYSIVGLIGTMELACYSVLINFITLVGLPAWGLGTAGATLVGQALGQKNIPEATQWAWDVIKLGMVGMFILGIPFWVMPETLLSIWIHDEQTRQLAIWPTRILGLMITFNGIGYMLSTMLNGAGDVKRVTMVNLVTQWFLLVPGAYLLGPTLGFGLIGIWCLHQFGYRAGQAIIFAYFWRQGKWSRIII